MWRIGGWLWLGWAFLVLAVSVASPAAGQEAADPAAAWQALNSRLVEAYRAGR